MAPSPSPTHDQITAIARLRAGCVTVGSAPFTWDTIDRAFTGYYDTGDLKDTYIDVCYVGKNGVRHFHEGCPPAPTHWDPTGEVKTQTVALDQFFHGGIGGLTPSQRHHCGDQFTRWLPDHVRFELGALADARWLTRPWRSALYATERRGYQVLPSDNAPLETLILEQLAAEVQAYAEVRRERTHMAALARELRTVLAGWTDLLRRREDVAAADPHRPIIAWQRQLGLPALTGSEKQVRWAERIRFQLHAEAADDPYGETHAGLEQVLGRETGAGVWIALHQQGSGDVLGDWLDLRDRVARDAAWRAERDRRWVEPSSRW